MINTKLLDTKDQVNPFTIHLIELINKSNDGIGYMVKTRNGNVFHTSNMIVMKDFEQNWFFKTKSNEYYWYADGSEQSENCNLDLIFA